MPVEIGSLSDQIAQRRRDRARKRASDITIPVPGLEDLLAARYRRLSYEEKAQIARKHDGIGENSDEEVAAAADLLINACVDLVAPDGNGGYEPLGKRWSAQSIIETFQLEGLPDGVTTRVAFREALGSEDLMEHFGAYIKRANDLDSTDQDDLPGESKPSAEG